ncbi:uncharacterized protein METZ01_LOCUS179361 [marine metagenome]|uniref:Uncharacterized protein n=1 Tax=marine metagenome TaxID=408172 RepID=A0A382CMH8_9ZZZZ
MGSTLKFLIEQENIPDASALEQI